SSPLCLFILFTSNFGDTFISAARRRTFHLAPNRIDLKKRIQCVENGLLPSNTNGQPGSTMKLVDRMRSYKTPSVSIAVMNDGKLEWARGYGVLEVGSNKPVTTETLFQACSIGKPISAMAAVYLVQRGRLN